MAGVNQDADKDSIINQKKQKLLNDLDVVMENINLTNQIIDNCVSEKKMDSLLPEMIKTLKAMEPKVSLKP